MRPELNIFGVAIAACLMFPEVTTAQSHDTIGVSRMFNNDAIGDGRDRWRTGSYSYSRLWGRSGYDAKAPRLGDIVELRARSEIIAPLSNTPSPGDRPYVGAISLGGYSHFRDGATQYSLGAEIVAVGPQTGLSEFQQDFHELFDLIEPAYLDQQIADAFYFGVAGEAVQSFEISENVTMRPFLQVQLGIETSTRIGGDLVIGSGWQSDVLLRDVVTGQIHPGVERPQDTGLTFILGADTAFVFDSVYLPEEHGFAFQRQRSRLRAGANWQVTESASVYYGLTYLTPEFIGQPEGQTTGSLRFNYKF